MNGLDQGFAEYLKKPVTVKAHSNIALIKYWGKRSEELNLPAVGSISMTLDALNTITTLQFDHSLSEDIFTLNGKNVSGQNLKRVSRFLDVLANRETRPQARIKSRNNFPTSAGLASSASGFAALAKAASQALNLNVDNKTLSKLARRGSGSAARSVYGGFVEMRCGKNASDKDDYSVQLHPEDFWDIRLIIAVTSTQKKDIGSSTGMKHTAQTSPYYNSWVQSSADDIIQMRNALAERNFQKVGELTEQSSFKMHGLIMSARPSMLYWNPVTVQCIQTFWDLRAQDFPVYLTIDAGPQVKILCKPEHVQKVREILNDMKGIQQIITARPGPGISILNKYQ